MPETEPNPQWEVVVTDPGREPYRHPFRYESDARYYYSECAGNGWSTSLVSDGLVVQSTEPQGDWITVTAEGKRRWVADSVDHAIEQHYDADLEPIIAVYREVQSTESEGER